VRASRASTRFETVVDLCFIGRVRSTLPVARVLRQHHPRRMHSALAHERPVSAALPHPIVTVLSWVVVLAPALFLLVFALHFRSFGAFFDFKLETTPRFPAPEVYVSALIAAGSRAPLLHEPHMIAYLSLPLSLLATLALYVVGRDARPLASACTLAVSLTGFVFMGGLFGIWSVLFRGFGGIDPRDAVGATAAWRALTAPGGALGVTTTLAKLAIIGQGLQALCLLGTRAIPAWASIVAALGWSIITVFWDIDNWMFVGDFLVLLAMTQVCARLLAMRAGVVETRAS